MKNKIKEIFQNKIFLLILGIFIGGTTCVYAVTYFPSNQVTYDNNSSKLNATNVQTAIDELYGKCKVCSSAGGSSGSGNIYVVDQNGEVYKSTGGNFSSIGGAPLVTPAVGIAASGNNIYVVDQNGRVYKSTGGNFSSFGSIPNNNFTVDIVVG